MISLQKYFLIGHSHISTILYAKITEGKVSEGLKALKNTFKKKTIRKLNLIFLNLNAR